MEKPEVITSSAQTKIQPIQPFRAIVWGRDDLLAQAVGSYLKQTLWEVIHVSNNGDVENLTQQARQITPDVVILCQEKAGDDSPLAWLLINKQLCIKVVTIAMDSNRMNVYSKQNILLQGASDLLSVIEPGLFTNWSLDKEVDAAK